MYDFQNTEFAQSHLKFASCRLKPRMDRLPVAKQTIKNKACIGWHDYVGCYAKKKNNKKLKLFDSLEIHESFEFNEFFHIHESLKIHGSLKFMNHSNRDSDSLNHSKD